MQNLGIDGFTPEQGPSSAGRNSGQTEVIDVPNPGTWTDTTDIRQTELYLTGLTDDYTGDGQVIAPILTRPNHALGNRETQRLGACYKQLNSSVGQFGAYTLTASTNAVESNSARRPHLHHRQQGPVRPGEDEGRAGRQGQGRTQGRRVPVTGRSPPAGAQLVACGAIIAGAKLLGRGQLDKLKSRLRCGGWRRIFE